MHSSSRDAGGDDEVRHQNDALRPAPPPSERLEAARLWRQQLLEQLHIEGERLSHGLEELAASLADAAQRGAPRRTRDDESPERPAKVED